VENVPNCVCMADNLWNEAHLDYKGQVVVSQLFCRKMPWPGEAVVFPPASAGPEWNNHSTRVGPHLGLDGRQVMHCTGMSPDGAGADNMLHGYFVAAR
jgi:hypothetical protein